MKKIVIQKNDEGQSLFKFIKKSYSTTPLSVIYKWFRTGKIKVNNKKTKDQKFLLKSGDEVWIYDTNNSVIRDQFRREEFSDLQIVYEDSNLVIIDKPHNTEVHSPINNCLDNKVKSYLLEKQEYNPDQENSFMVSHVHRLDKLTRGLIIYAKNRQALEVLLLAIKDKQQIKKTYWAQLESDWSGEKRCDGWIKYNSDLQKAVYQENFKEGFKEASTVFSELIPNSSWVEVLLETGRKHQIRATLEFLRKPIKFDFRYGAKRKTSDKLIMLFAVELEFANLPEPLQYLNDVKISIKEKIKELYETI
ncbi:ribosomal large subunit pseudouridine synthase C [Spiroplasma sabaudiense Ar-1343]|uniref:RNA pseudouridylate synthase n=1 Tax=Spiroplasma sabaudiense Ar-1343 TaxID=1276257 RepID=W6A9E9_9MOLU|nr:RluA family pseudouridine synthase [Spiroplasma sabaudiense]AHI53510.1 ribosomal large subunit pseudouridine synthase C [Spiroplasma sabaudiense Ar-1343]